MRTLQRTVRETNSPVRDDAPPATRGRTPSPSARPGARGAATRKKHPPIDNRRLASRDTRNSETVVNRISSHFFSSFFLSEGRMRFGGSRMRRASTERTRTTLLWIAALMQ